MTDDLQDDGSQDPEVLAAEYVLGTLASEERAQAEALIARDLSFARRVRSWERRLGELHAMVPPIEPPAATWAAIAARIEGAPPSAEMRLPDPGPPIPAAPEPRATEGQMLDLLHRIGRLRQVALGLGALAAVLVALIVASALEPHLLPSALRPKPVEIKTVERETHPGRFVAVLQQDAASPAFILTVDVDARAVTVRRVAAEQEAGKSYELWLVSDQFPAPRSLGLVGADEFSRPTLANYDPNIISSATYAVSLEPEGGSPTGAPTGPLLFSGKLVEAVPPAP
jgi:anti-sigma-K factor RskA